METNKEIRNDELKVSMITLKLKNDKESEETFISELKKAYFLIPAIDDDKDDQFTFMLLSDQNNNNYFQSYTDLDEYTKWPNASESKHFVLTFDEFANIIISSDEEVKGLVINPFSENIILNKEFIGNIFRRGKIYIDELSNCPTKVKNAIKKVLKQNEKINKAYLMNIKKNNIPGYLLIVDSSEKNKKKLHDEIGSEITSNIDQINIDIISANDKLGKDIIKDKKAFYERV